ncbi:TetR/AcrR family transcriptional regulator [Nanchangia anserum]|uniref:TetR/AcrR family transcriptional regulator n=1 Tax=Nanchangia anserum TaxID=2692125 RepID=A0A8I0GEI2_9ACTO|nr:TetR/AcrR family transcriptional regulator [Nanchangia anserum]MBD3689382.1 TetR/AcrR family transcriptional regulator [Nanchangia anserum]QOX81588.1 TetR/AcrR family transcriptional regulator [Nanchangia anserum]
MAPQSRAQRRREETRRRIVETAVSLFEKQGFDATTVDQITEAADIGKGTFFTHFPTKEDVFSYLSEQVLDVMLEADDASAPADERVRRSFQAAATWFSDNEAIARQMALARIRSMGKTPASAERTRLLSFLAEIAADGMRSGVWRDIPAEHVVQGLAACYFSSVALWALEPQAGRLEDVIATQLDVVFNGLRA